MKCPVDQVDLLMTERQGVEIDYCPKCRGVWLDRGELDKIMERSAQELASASAPVASASPPPAKSYGDGRRHDDEDKHHPHKKKKRSFFEDLFD